MDFLKTLRTAHRLLMVLSATAVLTATVSNSTASYRRAFEELEKLEDINTVPISSLITEYLAYLLGIDMEGSDETVIVSVIPPAQEDLRDPGNFMARFARGVQSITRLLGVVFRDEQLTFSTASLSQIRSVSYLHFYMPIPDEKSLEGLRACVNAAERPRDVKIVVEYPEGKADLALPGEAFYANPPVETYQLMFGGAPRLAKAMVSDTECLEFPFTWHPYYYVLGNIEAKSDVFRVLKGGATFSNASALKMSELPVWAIISDMTIPEAKREIARRLELASGPRDVLGIATVRTLVVFVVPILIAVMLGIMWLHSAAAHGRVKRGEATEFAWVGIYPGRLNQLLTIISVALVPVLCGAYLWFNEDYVFWMQFAMLSISAALGIAALRTIEALRRQAHVESVAHSAMRSTQ
jgi:hypothetical protein